MNVKPKKKLGQHFLTDKNIAKKIVDGFEAKYEDGHVLEIGPGTGILTFMLASVFKERLTAIDLDQESVDYLNNVKAERKIEDLNIVFADFLKFDLSRITDSEISIIGNFPYNISSQIFFKILENREKIPLTYGMIQREVADRIVAPPGNKTYGILSVLLQAFYDLKMELKVPPGVFNPPPKVNSAVISMVRKENFTLDCDERLFFRIVKQSFQNRRKTLRNSLKTLILNPDLTTDPIFGKRPEQLSFNDFVFLTNLLKA